jgi:excisionase family DNA binding protein
LSRRDDDGVATVSNPKPSPLRTEISTATAARILRISTEEVRKLITSKKLEARRSGFSPWRVGYASVIDYMQQLEAAKKKK